MFSVWMMMMLLLLTETQADRDPQISCTSHISTRGSNLTCRVLQHQESNHEEEIRAMSVCFTDWSSGQGTKCLQTFGDSLSSKDLNPLLKLNLSVHLSTGRVSSIVDLRTIVKPLPPVVWNVSVDETQAVIHFRTPYLKDYLNANNQVFQLDCSSAEHSLTVDVPSTSFLQIPVSRLRRGCDYELRVRAAPTGFLQGSWSEWSSKVKLSVPAGNAGVVDRRWLWLWLLVGVVSMLMVVFLGLCGRRLLLCLWPSVPHPKKALLHICHVNKALLLKAWPEDFSTLRVTAVEKQQEEPPPVELPSPSCSFCEQQFYSLLCTSPSPSHSTACLTECRTEQTEAYVTMSSFCQTKGEESRECPPTFIHVPGRVDL
ncbi:interleukin-7 receptor subunit alpha [Gouania willdenowi]|uniref:Fibronectin type-III domain-containing protein n=1 Tax=Gouania willdenowi TaxID=441366 RepID=A0A8C5DZP9_GOUWI|nr:interleukin-7 receptor subunit alpha [Gouania willdenowi]